MFDGDVSELVWENGHLSQVNFGVRRDDEQVPFASPLLSNSEFCKNVEATGPCDEGPEKISGSDETGKFIAMQDDCRRRTDIFAPIPCADGKNDASSGVHRSSYVSCHRPRNGKDNSDWSQGASNEISSFPGHRRNQTEDEQEAVAKQCNLFPKRKRNSEEHRLFEKRRRKKINDKLKTLHNLIPNGREEVAKALLLDQVITHIKALQRHLQMMTMMSSNMYRYMPPVAFPAEWGQIQMHPLVCLPHGASSPAPFLANPLMKYPLPPVMFPLAPFQDALGSSHRS